MKKTLQHILAVLLISVAVFSSCSKQEEKIIPRKKMSRIYAEMLVLDQWINLSQQTRKMTDTTLVYEPILEKYGYTSEDYRRSVYKYLDDPERYARILRSTSNILDKRIKELKARKDDKAALEERLQKTERFRPGFDAAEYFPLTYKEPYIHYYDSVAVDVDTVTCVHTLRNVDRSDTVYEGLVMVIRIDSTAIADSIARADSLAKVDSLARIDSLARLDSLKKLKKPGQLNRVPSKSPSVNKDIQKATDMNLSDKKE